MPALVLIPYESGSVSDKPKQFLIQRLEVLIPYESGSVSDVSEHNKRTHTTRLNPLRIRERFRQSRTMIIRANNSLNPLRIRERFRHFSKCSCPRFCKVGLNPLRIRERFRQRKSRRSLMHPVLIPYESGSVSDITCML